MGYFWDFLSNIDNFEWVIRKAFNSIDTDGSGEISPDEILNTINYINSYCDTGISPTEEQLKMGISYCDIDKNGKLNFDEFMNLLRKLARYEFTTPATNETETQPQAEK